VKTEETTIAVAIKATVKIETITMTKNIIV
jgi:hypothetical protein